MRNKHYFCFGLTGIIQIPQSTLARPPRTHAWEQLKETAENLTAGLGGNPGLPNAIRSPQVLRTFPVTNMCHIHPPVHIPVRGSQMIELNLEDHFLLSTHTLCWG